MDAFLCSQIATADFTSIIPEKGEITLSEAFDEYFKIHSVEDSLGVLQSQYVVGMYDKVRHTKRFSSVRLRHQVNLYNKEKSEQFSALTMVIPDGSMVIGFRGTDDTIIGWKEDCNLSVYETVPAQKDALDYLSSEASFDNSSPITICGHSKGGNLAVYAATFCGKRVQRRIGDVYNNDGPGFELSITQAQEFQEISECVHTFVPNQSIVGMLLEHEEDYVVVESHETGLLQHDPFSWQLDGPHFQVVEQVSGGSKMLDRSVKSWLRDLSSQERERVVDGLFEILSSSQASTISELVDTWKKNPGKAVSAFLLVNAETRRLVWRAFQQLFRATHQEIKLDIKLWLQEKLQDAETTQVIVPE